MSHVVFGIIKADQFANDIAHIPWDIMNLRDESVDNLDAFNDLLLACLDNYAPIKTMKIRHKPNPFHRGHKGFDEGEKSPSQKSKKDWDEGRLGGF